MQTELTEQVIVIWILTILILISLIILVILTILIKITLIKAGVMRRLRSSQDPWEQLGVARGANREEVLIIITILNVLHCNVRIPVIFATDDDNSGEPSVQKDGSAFAPG